MFYMRGLLGLLALVKLGDQAEGVVGPISDHFVRYLSIRSKRNDQLLSHILQYDDSGSFGGKMFSGEKITNTPIVFIHGNSDSALKYGESDFQSGWSEVVEYFLSKDYTLSELYGITYGDRNITNSFQRKFTCETLRVHRKFIESVLHYTKKFQVHIIAHSMGVSIARRVIKGGLFTSDTEECNLGDDISHHIGVLIGISSANYGMCPCQYANTLPACGMQSGFYPGTCNDYECGSSDLQISEICSKVNYSTFLEQLNANHKKEADFIASLWSDDDEVLGNGNLVWGRQTSLIPRSDLKKIYRHMNHTATKRLTVSDQYAIIAEYEISKNDII